MNYKQALDACGLRLERPLAVVDTETTGTNTETDRVVEVGVVVLSPEGLTRASTWRINPGVPIPLEATDVHGITDADVAESPGFGRWWKVNGGSLVGCDLAGFNARRFDIPILRAELRRAGYSDGWPHPDQRVIDACDIFHTHERRDLAAAVRFYCGRELVGAHGAQVDAGAALDVLLGQLARYPDLPRDLSALDVASGGRQPDWATDCGRIRWDAEGRAVLFFGKYSGQRLADVDRGFLRWMLHKDFPGDVLAMVSEALDGRAPRRP